MVPGRVLQRVLTVGVLVFFGAQAFADPTVVSATMDVTTDGTWRIVPQLSTPVADADKAALKLAANWNVVDMRGEPVKVLSVSSNLDGQPFINVPGDGKTVLKIGFGKQDPVTVTPLDTSKVVGLDFEPPPSPSVSVQQNAATTGATQFAYDFELPFVSSEPDFAHYRHWSGGLSTTGTLQLGDTNSSTLSGFINGYQYLIDGLPRTYRFGVEAKIGTTLSGPVKAPLQAVGYTASGDFSAELPWTDFPVLALHRWLGYSRATVPLTFDVIPAATLAGKGTWGGTVEADALYELSLHPLFNLQPKLATIYDLGQKSWSTTLTLRAGAAVSALPNLGIPRDYDHNFVFLSYGWNWAASKVVELPVGIGFSTVF